jgi:hypothetical protein
MAYLAPDVEPTFDGHEAELEQYRSVSVAAVFALVLGLLSPLAVLHPVLWAVPLAGIVVGLFALFQLRSGAGQLTGRRAAVWGLALCAVFGAAGPARYLSRQSLVRREARQMADQWLGYLRAGDQYKAHQLIFDPGHRAPLDDALPRYYERNREERTSLAGYVVEEPMKTLLALGDKARIENVGAIEHQSEGQRDVVVQQYRVSYPEAGQTRQFYVQVALTRQLYGRDRLGQWSVGKATMSQTPQ